MKTCVGHNGKGVDCSNFSSFVYNQGFGIKMSSAIERADRGSITRSKEDLRSDCSTSVCRKNMPSDGARSALATCSTFADAKRGRSRTS